MAFWNYRIRKRRVKSDFEGNTTDWYDIVEAHYDTDGNLESWTAESMSPEAEDLQGIHWTLEHMLEAITRPIFDEEIELQRLKEKAEKDEYKG